MREGEEWVQKEGNKNSRWNDPKLWTLYHEMRHVLLIVLLPFCIFFLSLLLFPSFLDNIIISFFFLFITYLLFFKKIYYLPFIFSFSFL